MTFLKMFKLVILIKFAILSFAYSGVSEDLLLIYEQSSSGKANYSDAPLMIRAVIVKGDLTYKIILNKGIDR